MRLKQCLTLAVALVVLGAGTALAGNYEHKRNGFFIGFGVGGGVATLDSDLDSEGGGMGMFRIGFAPKDNLTVGLEANGWTKEVDGVTVTFTAAGPGVTYYPGNNGFYIKGAIGVGSLEAEVPVANNTIVKVSDSGFGFLAALGWEARLTRKFALGAEGSGSFIDVSDALSGTKFLGIHLTFNWYWSKDEA